MCRIIRSHCHQSSPLIGHTSFAHSNSYFCENTGHSKLNLRYDCQTKQELTLVCIIIILLLVLLWWKFPASTTKRANLGPTAIRTLPRRITVGPKLTRHSLLAGLILFKQNFFFLLGKWCKLGDILLDALCMISCMQKLWNHWFLLFLKLGLANT